MINQARVKRGMYVDSITLMQLARSLSALEGIEEATALMATPANLQLLAEAGLAPFVGITDEPRDSDVLIVVRALDAAHAEAALDTAEMQLSGQTRADVPTATEAHHIRLPRSLEQAARMHPQANIAVISVPGMYAALEAQQALRAGLHVFLFSDNVSLEDEIALKSLGSELDLLVMGPDCGTARLNGMGLGFVNVVPDGPVGIVGASGTGMQQVMCLLAQAGHGISQAIGCGGRDLSAEVGGITALQGLHMLQEDMETRVIVLISKPPAPAVAERVLATASSGTKPVVVIFLGTDPDIWQGTYGAHVHFARTLSEAARLAGSLCETELSASAQDADEEPHKYASLAARGQPAVIQSTSGAHADQPPYLAALFAGGTLCDEALHIWGELLGPVYSNIPLNPAWRWREGLRRQGHYALDLGSDEYTRGRPHPMIDPEARLKYLREAANDPQIGVILLDIVLGYCAHPDPAAIYAPTIQQGMQQASHAGRALNYVISLCGTTDDPQQLSRQQASLHAAGAEVYVSNAEAALRCIELLAGKQG
jgi:FdrA protein